jgi:hypothetical protein
VGPRAGLDDVEMRKSLTLSGLELRPLGRAPRSQSLYRLRYPDPLYKGKNRVLELRRGRSSEENPEGMNQHIILKYYNAGSKIRSYMYHYLKRLF